MPFQVNILGFCHIDWHSFDLKIAVFEAKILSRRLRNIFQFQQPEIIIIQHYGGGSGLLKNEIREALDKRAAEQKARFNFFNGAFN